MGKQDQLIKQLGEFMRTNPRVKEANHTLVSLLIAARGTIADENETGMTYGFVLENEEAPELSGRYEVSIKKLED